MPDNSDDIEGCSGSLGALLPEPAQAPLPDPFDLQGHRGARGWRPENTLPAFAAALDIGVHTLELDVGVTADDAVVVTHDRVVSPLKCRDTVPLVAGDPSFPYVGKPVRSLSLAQLRTLDLGRRYPLDPNADPFLNTQHPQPGTGVVTLEEVFELAAARGADDVRFNIETKVDPRRPEETLAPEPFTCRLLELLDAHGMAKRASVQSFDWRTLVTARREMPEVHRVALVERRTVHPPWLAGLDPRAFDWDVTAAASTVGAGALSPHHPFLDSAMMRGARRHGLDVIPWTVNEPVDMRRLLDLGVDGLITDYPDRARAVLAERAATLPSSYPAPAVAVAG